jgi:regulator of nucleoside diphosphate kinase
MNDLLLAESQRPPIVITDKDHARLESCLARALDARFSGDVENLEIELGRARIVPEAAIPPNVVTLNTTVIVEDCDTLARRVFTVALPEHADYDDDRISVLAPVGAAVIGLRVDDEIRWPLPNGRVTRLRVVEILYQPEAAKLERR